MLPASAGMIPVDSRGLSPVVVLPASEGMIPDRVRQVHKGVSAPRVRGDDPDPVQNDIFDRLCSPRPRG